MKTYNLEDVFKFAINMEEQGRQFYEVAAQYARKKNIKNLFSYLAKAEVKHAKVFLKFHKIYAKKKTFFTVDETFEEVLDGLLRGLLLPDISEVRDMLLKRRRQELISIIKIAMDVELNTILFYQKLKEVLGRKQPKQALDKIIKEEEQHLIKLKNLRLDFDPFYAGLRYGKFF
jgi:rubrerythrin